MTREPGGSPRAETLRKLLLSGRFAAARRRCRGARLRACPRRPSRCHRSVRRSQAGSWVISDRFMDSTRAYQGAAGADPALLDLLDEIVVGAERPDLTLILDVPARVGMERTKSRSTGPTGSSAMRSALHEARRQAFLDIAARGAGSLRRDRRGTRRS